MTKKNEEIRGRSDHKRRIEKMTCQVTLEDVHKVFSVVFRQNLSQDQLKKIIQAPPRAGKAELNSLSCKYLFHYLFGRSYAMKDAQIIKILGAGENGVVFLMREGDKMAAVKVGKYGVNELALPPHQEYQIAKHVHDALGIAPQMFLGKRVYIDNQWLFMSVQEKLDMTLSEFIESLRKRPRQEQRESLTQYVEAVIPLFVKLAMFNIKHLDFHTENLMIKMDLTKRNPVVPLLIDFGFTFCGEGWELYDLSKLANCEDGTQAVQTLLTKVYSTIAYALFPHHPFFKNGKYRLLTKELFDEYWNRHIDSAGEFSGCQQVNWRRIKEEARARGREIEERSAHILRMVQPMLNTFK